MKAASRKGQGYSSGTLYSKLQKRVGLAGLGTWKQSRRIYGESHPDLNSVR
jgi:hypothetical protein